MALDHAILACSCPDLSADFSQTRMTVGFAHDFSGRHRFGAFFRYGLIEANDTENLQTLFQRPLDLNSTRSSGHSSEFGMRLRGLLTSKLYYGIAASWFGLSLTDGLQRSFAVDSHQRNRLQRETLAVGLG